MKKNISKILFLIFFSSFFVKIYSADNRGSMSLMIAGSSVGVVASIALISTVINYFQLTSLNDQLKSSKYQDDFYDADQNSLRFCFWNPKGLIPQSELDSYGCPSPAYVDSQRLVIANMLFSDALAEGFLLFARNGLPIRSSAITLEDLKRNIIQEKKNLFKNMLWCKSHTFVDKFVCDFFHVKGLHSIKFSDCSLQNLSHLKNNFNLKMLLL